MEFSTPMFDEQLLYLALMKLEEDAKIWNVLDSCVLDGKEVWDYDDIST